MDWSSSAASQTKLPDDEYSIDTSCAVTDSQLSRLSAVANYSSLSPVALAASSIVLESYSDSSTAQGSLVGAMPTSAVPRRTMGAVAGKNGVVLIDWEYPQVPLLVLSSTIGVKTNNDLLALEFSTPPRYLAQCRSQSVVVWDVSGQSSSPLCSRITDTEPFVDMSWQPHHSNIVTATARTAALWDIRQSANLRIPTIRAPLSISPAPFQQVACEGNLVGLLDATGMLRLLDLRMTGYWLASWQAHHHAGVGLEVLPTTTLDTPVESPVKWVTWGLDDPNASAVVKIWSTTTVDAGGSYDSQSQLADDYWSMDSSVKAERSSVQHHLVGQCTTRNFTCARVADDHVVLVGVNEESSSWKADAFRVKGGLSRVGSVGAGEGFDQGLLRTAVNSDWERLGDLQAVQLGLSSDGNRSKVVICSLTTSGYVLKHVSMVFLIRYFQILTDSFFCQTLPEIGLQESVEDHRPVEKKTGTLQLANDAAKPNKITRAYPDTQETIINDAARVWASPSDGIDRGTHNVQTTSESGLLPFDMDIPFTYTLGSGNMMTSTLHSTGSGVGSGQDGLKAPLTADGLVEGSVLPVNRRVDKSTIPCPRLCGASFSPGIGGLSIFKNGPVQHLWSWYHRHNESTGALKVPQLVGDPANDASTHLQSGDSYSVFPRTLQDLEFMQGAAQEAQWGDQDSSGVSSDSYRIVGEGEHFFEDDSEGSIESQEVEVSHRATDPEGQNSTSFSKLSESQTAILQSTTTVDDQEDHTKSNSSRFLGASSDLSPMSWITYAYESVALHDQSKFLAENWKLGVPNNLESVGRHRSTAASEAIEKTASVFPPRSTSIRKEPVTWLHKELCNERTKTAARDPRSVILSVRMVSTENTRDAVNLKRIEVCRANASSSAKIDDKKKADVWEILARIVESRLGKGVTDGAFGGWGGSGGGTLGVGIVENLLHYYESVGDVQMLSTIVCVLKDEDDVSSVHQGFLPAGNRYRHDMYFRIYSNLLFYWGLVSKSAEVRKQITHIIDGAREEAFASFGFICPECGKHDESGNNYCRDCLRFHFQCAICEDRVRGLFTLCHR